jgi:hypothetical protein
MEWVPIDSVCSALVSWKGQRADWRNSLRAALMCWFHVVLVTKTFWRSRKRACARERSVPRFVAAS